MIDNVGLCVADNYDIGDDGLKAVAEGLKLNSILNTVHVHGV